jgi:hypothetical protein
MPKILILEVGAIAPAINLDSERVPPPPEMGCDIEFRRGTAPLTVTDSLAVYPQVEGGFHSGKMDKNPTFPPFVRDLEFEAVGTHRIVIMGDTGRIGLAKGIGNIGINGDAEAMHLPVRGNRKGIPTRVVIIRPVKIHDSIPGFSDPAELPYPVERANIRCSLRIILECRLYIGIDRQCRVRSPSISLKNRWILPIIYSFLG